jgi:hypothetical protein
VLSIHLIVKFIQAFAESCFDSSFGCSLPGGSGEREERETQGEGGGGGGGGGGGRLPRFFFFSLNFCFSSRCLFVCLFVFSPSFVNSRDGNETFGFFPVYVLCSGLGCGGFWLLLFLLRDPSPRSLLVVSGKRSNRVFRKSSSMRCLLDFCVYPFVMSRGLWSRHRVMQIV